MLSYEKLASFLIPMILIMNRLLLLFDTMYEYFINIINIYQIIHLFVSSLMIKFNDYVHI